jgi:aminoglycoside 2'-N-acetyltransferase I
VSVIAKRTHELTGAQRARIFRINDEAHAADHGHNFTAADQANAEGGTHFFVVEGDEIVSHASVVERELRAGEIALRAGYVEAVATVPSRWRRGLATEVVRAANDHVAAEYDLGALATGVHAFYERLGWVRWRGPTFVRAPEGLRRTAEEDGGVMVLFTPRTPAGVHLDLPLSCDWREGDVW